MQFNQTNANKGNVTNTFPVQENKVHVRTSVWVTTQFIGFHRWKDAPDEVKFLRDWHRHVFHVKLGVPVDHNNRDIEFILLKDKLSYFISANFAKQFEYSCEQIAEMIVTKFNGSFCEVSEDGENGALVERDTAWTSTTVQEHVRSEEMPSLKKRTKCFIGTEAEGPNRGTTTLFVPGSTTPAQLTDVLMPLSHDMPIYYGAGNDRAVRHDTFELISKWRSAKNIFVEVNKVTDEMDSWIKLGVKIISLNMTDHDPNIIRKEVDVEKNEVRWVNYDGDWWVNKLDDTFYSEDKEI